MVWNLTAKTENMQWSGLYHRNRTGIRLYAIRKFKNAMRIGDKIYVPVPKTDAAFRPNYQPICTVVEIHDNYVVVDHGEWREAIMYIDLMTDVSKAEVLMADYAAVSEYEALLSKYWQTKELVYAGHDNLSERLKSIEKRLEELEPLVDCHKRFICLGGPETVTAERDDEWVKHYARS